jgi:ATP phosphoribosyltransferase regulatory subunit
MQVGAELFGHAGLESDVEVQRLMLAALKCRGIQRKPQVDLGHVGVFEDSAISRGYREARRTALFQALQRKDLPELRGLLRRRAPVREALLLLPKLYGDDACCATLAKHLPKLPEIRSALRSLEALGACRADLAHEIRFDLGELRGYRYHSGVVFAAYAPGWRVRWLAADAMTRWDSHSGVPGPRPASAWICATSLRPHRMFPAPPDPGTMRDDRDTLSRTVS